MNNKKAINYIQDLGALIALVLLVLVVLVLAVLVLLVLAVLAVLGIVGAVVVLIVVHFFPHILPQCKAAFLWEPVVHYSSLLSVTGVV